MDSSTSVFYAAAGLPALVSTGITILYFFLKACSYVFNAISHQTKRRVAAATTGGGQQEHCANTGEEGHTEICEQIQGNLSEQYGGRSERSPGTILLSRRGQNIRLSSFRDDTRHTAEHALRENAKGLQSIRHRTPEKHYGKGPRTHVLTPQEYLRNVEAGTMPPMNNHNVLKEMAEKATANDQTRFLMMEFRDFKRPSPPKTPGPQKRK